MKSFSGEIPIVSLLLPLLIDFMLCQIICSLYCFSMIICARYFQYWDLIFFWVALQNFINSVQSACILNVLALLYNRCFC